MGQKIHPEGFRVGYIHDWKSNWYNDKEFADYLNEDLVIRSHIENKLSHAGLSEIAIKNSDPFCKTGCAKEHYGVEIQTNPTGRGTPVGSSS